MIGKLEPTTNVPMSFWTFISEFGKSDELFASGLRGISQHKCQLFFLVYTQLQADLADHFQTNDFDFTEDHSNDIADGAIANGLQQYNDAMNARKTLENESSLNQCGRYHVFVSVYDELYNADIFDQLDVIENGPLPWERNAG